MLFTFPSRYLSTIGLSVVFSLSGWSPIIQPEFLVLRPTQVSLSLLSHRFAYGALTLCGPSFQRARLQCAQSAFSRDPITPAHALRHARFGLFPVRSPLLGKSLFTFFSCGYLDVSVPRVRPAHLRGDRLAPAGLPHSEIRGSQGICPSPRLIAACHVLLRLREPRHPPYALVSLFFSFIPYQAASVSIALLLYARLLFVFLLLRSAS